MKKHNVINNESLATEDMVYKIQSDMIQFINSCHEKLSHSQEKKVKAIAKHTFKTMFFDYLSAAFFSLVVLIVAGLLGHLILK